MDNYCDASFDDTPHLKARLSDLAGYNGKPMSKGINKWWYSSEAKKLFCPHPNQSAYSSVQSLISMLEKSLVMHESYKDMVNIENGNDILSDYQIYRVRMKC